MWSDKDLWTCQDPPRPQSPLQAVEPANGFIIIIIYKHLTKLWWQNCLLHKIFPSYIFRQNCVHPLNHQSKNIFQLFQSFIFGSTCNPRQESDLSARHPEKSAQSQLFLRKNLAENLLDWKVERLPVINSALEKRHICSASNFQASTEGFKVS